MTQSLGLAQGLVGLGMRKFHTVYEHLRPVVVPRLELVAHLGKDVTCRLFNLALAREHHNG